MPDLTPDTLALFLAYAKDADNWSGNPLVGGNVAQTQENNGHLTHLKRAKLLTTFKADGDVWIDFTPAGKALAAEHGVTIN
jgi:hypothetical protein